jgi:hypothetical protein
MNAYMDSYTQLTARLSYDDAYQLKENGELTDFVWRTPSELLPLTIRAKKSGWRAEGIPTNKPYEKKKSYEIDIPPDGPDKILDGKIIGSEFPTISLRKVYIGLEYSF